MTINIIAAVAKNRAIGKDNRLIYWLPNDLKRGVLSEDGIWNVLTDSGNLNSRIKEMAEEI